jgi:RNA polymerase sigma-70 factor (ECF subfamily)
MSPDAESSSRTDSELVESFCEGREDAFDVIVKRHEATVRSVLYRVVGNADDAEDIAQETFMRVYENLNRFRGRASLKTWILRIAVNRARDLLRRRRRRPAAISLEKADPGRLMASSRHSPEAPLSLAEKARALAACIEQLPLKQRSALVMKVIGEMDYEEIAGVLGTTRNSVKSSVHAARRRLLAMLGGTL